MTLRAELFARRGNSARSGFHKSWPNTYRSGSPFSYGDAIPINHHDLPPSIASFRTIGKRARREFSSSFSVSCGATPPGTKGRATMGLQRREGATPARRRVRSWGSTMNEPTGAPQCRAKQRKSSSRRSIPHAKKIYQRTIALKVTLWAFRNCDPTRFNHTWYFNRWAQSSRLLCHRDYLWQ